MKRKLQSIGVACAAALVLGLLSRAAHAAGMISSSEVVPTQRMASNPAAREQSQDPEPRLTLEGGADVTSGYFYRGYQVENQGLILQPYATLSLAAVEADALSITPYVGTWNSIHSETYDAEDWDQWNESDVLAGVSWTVDRWTLDLSYNLYTYPNGNSRQQEEIGVIVSFDDTDFTGLPVALSPHLSLFHEIHDRSGSEDTYLELGIEPSLELSRAPVTIAMPVLLGMSIDDYYVDASGDNELFGYASVGIKGSYPLGEHWALNAGATYLRLLADSAVDGNDGDRNVVIGTAGVSFSY